MDTGHALASKVRLSNIDHALIVSKIADEEARHVEVSLKWFGRLSSDPHSEYLSIMKRLGMTCNWKINK